MWEREWLVMANTTFLYKAIDNAGQSVSGVMDASDEQSAFDRLVARGLSPFELKVKKSASSSKLFSSSKIKSKDLTRHMRQLATLLGAGVTLLETLETMAKSDAHPVLAGRTESMKKDLRAGKKLSEALEAHIPEYPEYIFRLAELGELTGSLSKALLDGADRMEYEETMRSEIRAALAYPAFLASVGGLIVLLMFLFVVPRFSVLLGDRIGDAPWLSQMVIGGGVWMRDNWLLAAISVVGFIVFIIAVMKNKALNEKMRSWAERAPLIGNFLSQADIGGWARTVSVALENKAPLIDALRLGENGARSPRFRRNLQIVRQSVRAGRPLDEALYEAQQDIDPVVIDLIRTGNNAGALGQTIGFAADIFEKSARERAKKLTALTEPFAILMISGVVGTIVISIVMAMTSLYDIGI